MQLKFAENYTVPGLSTGEWRLHDLRS